MRRRGLSGEVARFARRRALRPGELAGVATFGVAVTALHFGSMALTLYTRIWWWDLLVHALSGFGVAALIYVVRPRILSRPLALYVVLPAVVLAVGTWFEVYERLFTDFWVTWSRSVYLEDTLVDLVADTAGAVAFGLLAHLRSRYFAVRRTTRRLGRR